MSYKRKQTDNAKLSNLYKEFSGRTKYYISGVYFDPKRKRLIRLSPGMMKKYYKKKYHKKTRQSETLSKKEYDIAYKIY